MNFAERRRRMVSLGSSTAGGRHGAAAPLCLAILCQLACHAVAVRQIDLTTSQYANAPECDGTDMFCHANNPMKSTVVRVAQTLFLFIVFLTMCATFASIFPGKRTARNTFTLVLLLGLVVTLYYSLWQASIQSFPARNTDIVRFDCKHSNKGGKRANGDTRNHTINPCWCHEYATCRTRWDTELPWEVYHNGPCPIEKYDEAEHRMKHTQCRENHDGHKVYFYAPTNRDCEKGQGPKCTKEEPCTPCELDRLDEFDAERCTTCSPENKGDCNFIPGEGPYCFDKPGSVKAVPCKQCCTEARDKKGKLVYDSLGRCL